MRRIDKIKKGVGNFITIIAIVLLLLLIASIIDVNVHNNPASKDYQQFSSWNIFYKNN